MAITSCPTKSDNWVKGTDPEGDAFLALTFPKAMLTYIQQVNIC